MTHVTLTWQEFLTEAKDFLKLSKELDDDWEIYEKNKIEGNTFLKCKRKLQISLTNNEKKALENVEDTSMLLDDESTVNTESNEEVFLVEYHVLYSISYQVPMIYMQIQRSDGSIVELENVWEIFASNELMKTKTRSELLSILTQMEHPVLFKPFYAIHPCKTAELLGQTPQSENRIVTFISLMGPFLKLELDNRYGLTDKKKKLNKKNII